MQQAAQIALLLIALVVGFILLRQPPAPPKETADAAVEAPSAVMLRFVESQISDQEDVKDVRCWSSVNKIQTFLSGMPVELDAIGHRVERYVALIDEIWLAANEDRAGSAEVEIEEAVFLQVLKAKFPKHVVVSDGKTSFEFEERFESLKILDDSLKDYGDTIESWRLLQSWALRKESQNPGGENVEGRIPFSDKSLTQFRDFLVVFDIALLKTSKDVAMERKIGSVDVESMNIAFDQLQSDAVASQSKDD